MAKILVFGAGGQLGRAVAEAAPGNATLVTYPRDLVDITDAGMVSAIVDSETPDAIINAAAYTAVDRAEQETELAYAVNAAGAGHIARATQPKARLIHISTDFVFSKPSERPYRPLDETAPSCVYGKSKLDGERAVFAGHPANTVVLRTSWLYSATGKNFLTTMLNLMANKDSLRVVNDQYGSPTSAYSLARIIWKFVMNDAEGIYHWSDQGVTTWYDFAREIQSQALELGLLQHEIPIVPIPTSEYPVDAKRPHYSALDSSMTEAVLGLHNEPWQDELHKVLQRLKGAID